MYGCARCGMIGPMYCCYSPERLAEEERRRERQVFLDNREKVLSILNQAPRTSGALLRESGLGEEVFFQVLADLLASGRVVSDLGFVMGAGESTYSLVSQVGV